MLILIKNFQRNILRHNLRNRLRRGDHVDNVAFFWPIASLDYFAVYFDQPLVNESLHAGPRKMWDAIDEILVDATGKCFTQLETKVLNICLFLDGRKRTFLLRALLFKLVTRIHPPIVPAHSKLTTAVM